MTSPTGNPAGVAFDAALRLEVEDFLYREAALLDEWRLDEWLTLFTEDTRYVVPTTDLPDGDPSENLVFIDDDIVRLRARVVRLNSRHAHREYPWSRTRRFISNVRVTETTGMRSRLPGLAWCTGSECARPTRTWPGFSTAWCAPAPAGRFATAAPSWTWRRWMPTGRSALSCKILGFPEGRGRRFSGNAWSDASTGKLHRETKGSLRGNEVLQL